MDAPVRVEGYIVKEMVGRGTYGEVYKGWTKSPSKKPVAIKSILKSKLSKLAIDNLLTEISLLKKLKHQYIVTMLDFTWDERYIHIIMEYCDGGDLSSIIKKRQCLPEHKCRRFLQQLSSALKYLHHHNVVHMDLKPSNLLIHGKTPPILKMADFGFARHMSPEERETGLKGSPLYMAPEIFLSKSYDAKVDLWSIGVILYEALFGRAPYSSGSLDELLVKIKEAKPIVIPTFRPISDSCHDLLYRCLKRDPKKRISFEDFFNHSFLDLEHMPGEDGEDGYTMACGLVTQAMEADEAEQYNLALDLYHEALQYLVPILHYEVDAVKRAKIKIKVDGYVRRAEEVKKLVDGLGDSSSSQSDKTSSSSSQSDAKCSSRDIRSMSTQKSELMELSRVTPKLATGVEICESGDTYRMEGDLNRALDRWTAGLGVLVPLLQSEPRGRRRELLHSSITLWMLKAEKVKEALSVQEEVMEEAKGGKLKMKEAQSVEGEAQSVQKEALSDEGEGKGGKVKLGKLMEKKLDIGREDSIKIDDSLDGKQCGVM